MRELPQRAGLPSAVGRDVILLRDEMWELRHVTGLQGTHQLLCTGRKPAPYRPVVLVQIR
ncbi:hypothetical protein [Streptomyces sp. NPDC097610]|uniref:hypothetical protein n=1 Tax=Streptomyces sp. NPDC097610 TaxID=3157227 RepID=UPI0033337161